MFYGLGVKTYRNGISLEEEADLKKKLI